MTSKTKEIAESIKKAVEEQNEEAMKSTLIDGVVHILESFDRFGSGLHRLADAIEKHADAVYVEAVSSDAEK